MNGVKINNGLMSLSLATEWLHSPSHSSQAEPDGSGQLSAAEWGDAQCRVPPRHHAPAPGFTRGATWYCRPAHLQTGQRESGKQGTEIQCSENAFFKSPSKNIVIFKRILKMLLEKLNFHVSGPFCLVEWIDPTASCGSGRSCGNRWHTGQTRSLHLCCLTCKLNHLHWYMEL